MRRTVSLLARSLGAVALAMSLFPMTAAAIATNLKATTPEGGSYEEVIIIVDAKTNQEVARKDKDDPDRRRGGFWIFELSEGSYYAKNGAGVRSEPFQVKGPGPATANVTLPATAGAAAAAAVGFMLDIEGGYGHTSTGYDSWAKIDNVFAGRTALPTASSSFDIATNGGYLATRLYPPFQLSPNPAFSIRPFFEVTGQIFGSDTKSGAAFGVPGTTTLNDVEYERQSSVGFGFGTRFSWNCGSTEIAVSPTLNFQWDMGRFRQTIDERLFLPNALVNTNQSVTTSNVILGGNFQVKPWRDCGLYFFGGGGWKQPLNGDRSSIEGQTPGGFGTMSRLDVNGGWQAQTGIGYRFDLGNLGF